MTDDGRPSTSTSTSGPRRSSSCCGARDDPPHARRGRRSHIIEGAVPVRSRRPRSRRPGWRCSTATASTSAVVSLQPTLGLDAARPRRARSSSSAVWEDGHPRARRAPRADGSLARSRPGRRERASPASCVGSDALDRPRCARARRSTPCSAEGGFLFVHPSGGPVRAGAPRLVAGRSPSTRRRCRRRTSPGSPRARSGGPTSPVVFAILAGGGPFQLERLALARRRRPLGRSTRTSSSTRRRTAGARSSCASRRSASSSSSTAAICRSSIPTPTVRADKAIRRIRRTS